MTTWYVRTTGSDSAAGTSAATAFATIGKAMSTANASLANGDTIYVGAGVYRVTAAIAPKNMGSMTYLYGDTDGSKTGDAGEIVVTNYGTNDSTAPNNVQVFTFASKSYWTLGKIRIQGGAANDPIAISGTSSNITIEDCTVEGDYCVVANTLTFGTVLALTIRRCRMLHQFTAVYIQAQTATSGSGDINLATTIENCLLWGGEGALAVVGASGTVRRSGGITVRNCSFISSHLTVGTIDVSGQASTTYPVTVNNSLIQGRNALKAATSGQIVENYNVIYSASGGVPRTNVSAGANSISDRSRSLRMSLSHEASFGGVVRPFGEWVSGSPLATWGGTAVPADDINGVTRPASGAAQGTAEQALGPFERSNSATRETTTTRTGGTAIKIAGPGYHDFELAVSPVSTSVSVWAYKDATYGTAATGPQLIITNAGEAGFGGTSITSTGSTAAWAAMTATFTPTSAGIVTVRLQSNATVGSANVYFDDFSVA